MTARVLVAGIGNIFLSDDGFGVEVANQLLKRTVPEGVHVVDYGIRGLHLAYELLEGYDVLVLIDATETGDAPGTLVVLEPDPPEPRDAGDALDTVGDAHTMSPGVVLAMLAGLGGSVGRILVVGCQPAALEDGIGLSLPVAQVVDQAVDLCIEVLNELFATAGRETTE